MTKFFISLAYILEASSFYQGFKSFTYKVLEDNTFRYKKYFDFLMIFFVLSTIAILIYEVNHKHQSSLDTYEAFVILVFIFEYLGRFWISSDMHKVIITDYENANILNKDYKLGKSLKKIFSKKLEFILSPMAVVDLLAILPYYRPLRILRIFMIFRLFKILRYSNSLKEFLHVLRERKFELFTLGLLFITAIFFSSAMMYIFEGVKGVNPKVNDFFDAVYWSVITIATVGYGDITPVTMIGKVVTLVSIIVGILVIAFSTSIITTGLAEKMESIKEERVQTEANKMKDFIIICGFGKMGRYICAELEKLNQKFIILEIDKQKIEKAKTLNYLVIQEDCTNMDILESLNIDEASSIIILTEYDAVNLSTVLSARTLNKDINIISRVNNGSSENKFYIAGADKTVIFNDSAAFAAVEYLQKPVSFAALNELMFNFDTDVVIDEVEIAQDFKVINNNINLIDFKKYSLTLVSVINSNDLDSFIFNPLSKDYILRANDILIVVGLKVSIRQLKSDFMNGKFEVKNV